jgi:hypothetical protein
MHVIEGLWLSVGSPTSFTDLTPLWAYLDPGSGSMILQMLIAGLLSGLFFAKSAFQYLKSAMVRKSEDHG